jgi:hypothetical protein
MDSTSRTDLFARNVRLEGLLEELNGLIAPAEKRALATHERPKYPVLVLVGCPRSGTTLIMQWLARLRGFTYPSNLIARFYRAPYIGARIQQMLFDPSMRFRDELCEFADEGSDFQSSLGKTRGALEPNEFWYFWRRFFPYGEIQYLDRDDQTRVDGKTFVAELGALEAAFDKPLALKGMIANWNLSLLNELLGNVVFLWVRRDPFFTIQSLLHARQSHSGDTSSWYSFKPPSNWLAVDYEDFCHAPESVYQSIRDRFALQGYTLEERYNGPAHFQCANRVRVSNADVADIRRAYRAVSGGLELPDPRQKPVAIGG